jgi:Domain of unknown function (DUF4129)
LVKIKAKASVPKNIIKRYVQASYPVKLIPFILFLTLPFFAYAQDLNAVLSNDTTGYEKKEFSGINDTLKIDTRSFSSTEVDKLKSDSDLNYQEPPTIAESLWDRFKQWLSWFFESLFKKAVTTDLGRIIMYTLAGILLIVVIMMLLKVNAFKVFYSGADQGRQNYQVFHENIHEMDFEKLIQDATEKNEFRLATRLIFLHALKLLSDKHLIEFNAGKTNHDYVGELTTPDLKTGLNELSFYFDYAWYGNFAINDTQFQRIKNTFAEWRTKMS